MVRAINSFIPQKGSYLEPFLGAGRIMMYIRAERRYGSDANPHIIRLLQEIQKGWEPPETLSQKQHEKWKFWAKRGKVHPMTGFAGFGCSFGGDFFHTLVKYPEGRNGNPAREARNSLLKQKKHLLNVNIRLKDYRDYLCVDDWPELRIPDVVFCDPPYEGTSWGWDNKYKFDSKEFWEWAVQWSEETTVLVSEYNCPVPEAIKVWERTLAPQLRKREKNYKKVEKLFLLSPHTRKRVGFGLL